MNCRKCTGNFGVSEFCSEPCKAADSARCRRAYRLKFAKGATKAFSHRALDQPSERSNSSSSNSTSGMQANNAGSWAAGDAALVLELQQPHPLALTDSPADIAVEAAAAPAHGASMLEPTKAATGFSGHVGCPSEGGPSLPQQLSSIYHVFTRRQRGLILGWVSVSQFINPFSSSIILPSLKVSTLFHERSCRVFGCSKPDSSTCCHPASMACGVCNTCGSSRCAKGLTSSMPNVAIASGVASCLC